MAASEGAPTGARPVDGEAIDLGKMLSFFFEDPDWVTKLLVGSLFALLTPVLVGTVFIVGYAMFVAKHTMERREPSLPEWDDLQGILVDGLKGLAISLAHKLPVFVLTFLLLLALVGSQFARGDDELALVYLLPAMLGGWLLVFLVSLALLVYVPAAFVRFVRTGRLGAAFEVPEVVTFIRSHTRDYFVALLGILLAGLIGQLGFAAFCIGIFPATFWAACAMGYVIGELARLDGPDSETTPSA